ncbi:MAG: transporter substrate-binding domain-containing protein, partial [Campylobacterota bacterium]|nr:transporter substrate-binding domain-containing protein [Campylobacterota bacterium]
MKKVLLSLFVHIVVCVTFASGNNSSVSELKELTDHEKEYIKNNTFHAITTTTWIPFNFEDNEGQIVGIGVEYLKLISNKIGMDIKIDKADNFSEVLKKIKNKKYDLNMVTTKTKPKEAYSIFTKSYERFPIAVAVKKDTGFIQKTSILEGKRVAVGKNYSAYTLLKKKYPGIVFVQVLNTKEAVKLVGEGKVFAAVDILPALQQVILNTEQSNSVKIGGITDVDFKLQLMIRDDYKMLRDILNKAIDAITVEDRNQIYRGWITGKKVSEFDYMLFYELFISVLIIIGIILWWNNKLHKEIQKRIETEKILQKQKEKLSEILTLLPVPILITQKDTSTIVFANEYSQKQYNIPKNKLIGSNVSIIYSCENQRETIKNAMDEDGYLTNYETLYKLPNGETIDALLSIIPLVFNDKDCILGIISDITQIKKVQRELELQTQIAQSATKARGEFLAN